MRIKNSYKKAPTIQRGQIVDFLNGIEPIRKRGNHTKWKIMLKNFFKNIFRTS